MLELCKSVLSFLLLNCILKNKNAKSSGYERYRDRAIKKNGFIIIIIAITIYVDIEIDKSVTFPSSKSTAHA